MAPKSSNLNTTPKKKSNDSNGGSNGGSGGGGSSKVSGDSNNSTSNPVLIVRPSQSKNLENVCKLYVSIDILRSLSIAGGDTIIVGKQGERGIIGLAAPSKDLSPAIILISGPLRSVSGLLAGDRVVLTKYRPRLSKALSVDLGCQNPDLDKYYIQEILKNSVETMLKAVGLVMPGLRIQVTTGTDEGETTVNDEVVITNATDQLVELAGLDDLSLDDDTARTGEKNIILHPQLLVPAFIYEPGKTQIVLSSEVDVKGASPSIITYSSIGGLSKQIEQLRSKIELPLHRPSLFQRFHTSPDRGFLLHGPPGTGKTMILRAVAHETNAHVLTINGPSIVSKYLGETEGKLRAIFEEATLYQPSIIFIDEIDALVPKRDSDDSGEAESRVVSTLLTLMDGMGTLGQTIVIGATNRPNSIDPALRRPGRFGQEIEIGIPNIKGREEILRLQLSNMPRGFSDQYITNVANRTHGFVGADLTALCKESVMLAIKRSLDQSIGESQMKLESGDVEQALLEIRPSAMREIVLETPKVLWTDVGGQENVIQRLKETIEWPLSHSDKFKQLGIQAPKGILLYGPPGCSKTLIAKALATETGLNFLAVKGPELFNKFVGESERAVREIFRKARAAAPSIIFFDEIDALSKSRGHGEAGGDRVLTSLLNEMDGIEALVGVRILAATNMPDIIDPALMRPGRLDRLIYVSPPDLTARIKILDINFKKMSINKDVDLEALAAELEGCSGAEVAAVCQEAGLIAMNENIEIESICQRHFDKALKTLKKAITKEMIEYYMEFEKEGRAL